MSWPGERTPPFYVHDCVCVHCGTKFDGFSRSKYCSKNCIEMSKRSRMMMLWGVPADIIDKLTKVTHV